MPQELHENAVAAKLFKGEEPRYGLKETYRHKLIRKQGNGLLKIVTRIRKRSKSCLLGLDLNAESKEA